jgi:hypothetical protein
MKYPVMFRNFLMNIWINMTNIGKTAHEDWGFYAQKVFVNKRHYAFALGISLLVLIIVFPTFKKMVFRLKKSRKMASEAIKNQNENAAAAVNDSETGTAVEEQKVIIVNPFSIKFKFWIREFFQNRDAWMPDSIKRSFAAGLLLGLIGFWNGSVVISTIPVLFFMALLSKHRLEYLQIAAISGLLVVAQIMFFTGTGASAGSLSLSIGYLADFPEGMNTVAKNYLTQNYYKEFFELVPGLSFNIFKFYLQLLGFLPLLLLLALPFSKKGGRWLTLAFTAPLVLATFCAFSSDVGANHVIVIYSVILLNIIIANLISRLFVSNSIIAPAVILGFCELVFWWSSKLFKYEKLFVPVSIGALLIIIPVLLGCLIFRKFNAGRVLSISVATILLIALTSSGIVDGLVLYNMDKSAGRWFDVKDKTINWIKDSTGPNDLFLINPEFIHPVLLAGRKVFNGGAYLVSTTGYDWDGRYYTVKQIYGATDEGTLEQLVKENKIKYIVVDDSNRANKDYQLNEELFKSTFGPAAFEDIATRTAIYKVE